MKKENVEEVIFVQNLEMMAYVKNVYQDITLATMITLVQQKKNAIMHMKNLEFVTYA